MIPWKAKTMAMTADVASEIESIDRDERKRIAVTMRKTDVHESGAVTETAALPRRTAMTTVGESTKRGDTKRIKKTKRRRKRRNPPKATAKRAAKRSENAMTRTRKSHDGNPAIPNPLK